MPDEWLRVVTSVSRLEPAVSSLSGFGSKSTKTGKRLKMGETCGARRSACSYLAPDTFGAARIEAQVRTTADERKGIMRRFFCGLRGIESTILKPIPIDLKLSELPSQKCNERLRQMRTNYLPAAAFASSCFSFAIVAAAQSFRRPDLLRRLGLVE
jgi:hypothetical protein